MLITLCATLVASSPLFKPDPGLVQLFGALVLPLVVGLITKKYASKAVKALTNAALVSLLAALTLASTTGLTLRDFAVLTVSGFLASSAAHEFLWKNLGVSEIIADLIPNSGIGRPGEIAQIAETDNGARPEDGPQPYEESTGGDERGVLAAKALSAETMFAEEGES